MRTIYFSAFFICIALFSNAQTTFSPPGAEWWYGFKGQFFYQEGWNHYVYEKDTVILDQPCKKLVQHAYSRYADNEPYQISHWDHFFTQTGDSVFQLINNTWLLRWRINPQPGDQFIIRRNQFDDSEVYQMTVDSIATFMMNGKPIQKTYYTAYGFSQNEPIGTEHIAIYGQFGPVSGDFNFLSCWGFADCESTTLCRYSEQGNTVFEAAEDACGAVYQSSGAHVVATPVHLGLSPNPATDQIQLDLTDFGAGLVSIVDMQGRLLWHRSIQTGGVVQAPVSDLAPGTYLVRVQSDQRVLSGRFVKVE